MSVRGGRLDQEERRAHCGVMTSVSGRVPRLFGDADGQAVSEVGSGRTVVVGYGKNVLASAGLKRGERKRDGAVAWDAVGAVHRYLPPDELIAPRRVHTRQHRSEAR